MRSFCLVTFATIALIFAVFAASPTFADGSKLVYGDVITVTVDGEKDLTKTYQVDSQGYVTLPMVAPVAVGGMSASDAAAAITKALTEVLVAPQVSVVFVERVRMQVFVVGQVKNPGAVQIGMGDQLVQALSLAGYDDSADLARINVRRGEEVIAVNLTKYLKAEDLSANIQLKSGDTVVVPKAVTAETVVVIGQVGKPGPVPLRQGATFREVLGIAGGATVQADTAKVVVKRNSMAAPLPVDYKRAMDGDPTADFALQPGDAIYVPQIETAYITILGGVQKPGQYPLSGTMNLSAGIGLAGGTIPEGGDLRNVTIVRYTDPGKPGQATVVNLKDILAKGTQEPVLQRGDIVYVKETRPKPKITDFIGSILSLGWLL